MTKFSEDPVKRVRRFVVLARRVVEGGVGDPHRGGHIRRDPERVKALGEIPGGFFGRENAVIERPGERFGDPDAIFKGGELRLGPAPVCSDQNHAACLLLFRSD